MLLSARMLQNVCDANTFDYVTEVRFTEEDGPAVYFQLIDKQKDRADQGCFPAGRRYAPAAGATLSVVIDNLDDDIKITRAATQPYSNDPSIWRVQLLSTDPIRGTANLRLTLTEGSVIRRGTVTAALCIDSQRAV